MQEQSENHVTPASEEKRSDKVKDLFRAFLGNPPARKIETPQFDLVPLETMLSYLVEIDDTSWGKYAFSRDPQKGRLDANQRLDVTQKAITCGQEEAQKLEQLYHSTDSIELAERVGLEVTFPRFPSNTDRVMYGKFTPPNKAEVYMDAVEKGNALLERKEVRKIMKYNIDIKRLITAHELFHYIEDQNKKTIWTRTFKVPLWPNGLIKNYSTIACLGEIAGMAFSKSLLRLQYSPYVLDVFLLYCYSPMEASGLYQQMRELFESE